MHLQPDELIDIAEGTRSLSAFPHLAGCEMCRKQVADLRSVMSMTADVNVPEPSPLFWNHFSVRVRDAIAATPDGGTWRWVWARFRVPIALGLAPALIVFGMLSARLVDNFKASPDTSIVFIAQAPPAPPQTLPDDSSFNVVAELAGDFDLDEAKAAGLTGQGSAEHEVTHMTEGELQELHRILKEELGNTGD